LSKLIHNKKNLYLWKYHHKQLVKGNLFMCHLFCIWCKKQGTKRRVPY